MTPSGFTFMFNNDIAFPQKIIVQAGDSDPDSIKVKKGLTWNSNQMVGYTFQFLNNKMQLCLTAGTALGIVTGDAGSFSIGDKLLTLGFAFHAGLNYYFTDKIGIGLSVSAAPISYSRFVDKTGGMFIIKVGPSFKL